jgi:hypothetical protein
MASHKYAILKFFGFVVWGGVKELVLLNAGAAGVGGASKSEVFSSQRKGIGKIGKPGVDWVTFHVSVVFATFN